MPAFTPEQKIKLRAIRDNPIAWAERYLYVHSEEGPVKYKANFVQRQVLVSVSRRTAICVSRRAGKTFGLAVLAIWAMFTKARCQILFIAPGEPQIEKFFETIDEILSANPELRACLTVNQKKPYRRKLDSGSYLWGFVAANGAKSLRGQSADYVIIDEADYIDDENWKAINPIIQGDTYRKKNPQMFAASTPNVDPKSRFMSWFSKEDLDEKDADINPILIPVTENKDFPEEVWMEWRKNYERENKMHEWDQEYLCIPGNSDLKYVFKKRQVDAAGRDKSPYAISHFHAITPGIPKSESAIRVLGVDWDQVQAGPSIMCVEWERDSDVIRVIHREEVDRNTPSLLHYTCEYIVELHKKLHYDYLMLEATKDVMQVEQILLLAKKQDPDLIKKVHAIDYNSNHVSLDIKTRDVYKRRMKQMIVATLQQWFSENRISYYEGDKTLNSQLSNYQILGYTERGPRYSKDNEHFVDTLGLCCWAIFKFHDNPFAGTPAVKVVTVQRQDNQEFIDRTTRQSLTLDSPYKSYEPDDPGNPNLRKRVSSYEKMRRMGWGDQSIRSRF